MINPTAIDIAALPQLPLSFYSSLPAIASLYFCTSDGEILYIGITKNLNARWRSHHKIYQLSQHNDVLIHWLSLEPDQLTPDLERSFIQHWEPKLNVNLPASPTTPVPSFNCISNQGWQRIIDLTKQYPLAATAYLYFGQQMNKEGYVIISQESLAEKLDVSPRSIYTVTKFLHDEKIIPRIKVSGSAYLYALNPDEIWKAANSKKDTAIFYSVVYVDKESIKESLRQIKSLVHIPES